MCAPAPGPQGPPPPELVLLEIPAELLADLPPEPELRGDDIADVATWAVEMREIYRRGNDQLYAARRVQNCHRRLVQGAIETC